MHISAYILPRRVVLTLLILLGLFLRLWGITWPQEGMPGHPYYQEWGEQIIANLSALNLVYREEIWNQGLYGVAVLIKGLLAGMAGWIEVWLGLARVSSEVSLQDLLAGRLAVAFMGTAQIWLAYQVARRWFNSVGTGLIAAAWLAVAPLMVMEGHYLDTGVPLGCMSLICLWCAHALQARFRWWHFLLAGLCLGLTITFKASGILVAPLFLWAAWLAWRQRRPCWRLLSLWLFCFLLGLWLGLTLGSPGFVLMLFRMHRNIWDSLLLPPLLAGAGWPYVQARAYQLFTLMHNWVGWLWLALWLAGLLMLFRKRNPKRMAVLFFPVLYIIAALLLLTTAMENLLAATMPLFIMLAAWPLVLICRRLPGQLLPGLALAAIGVLLLSYPLLNSLRIGYLFWQQPALNAAMEWTQSNLPAPPGLKIDGQEQYLLLPADANAPQLQLIKSFDLVSDWAPAWLPANLSLAKAYNLYGNSLSTPLKQPLGHARLPINPSAPFAMVFADNNAYSRNEGAIFMEKPMAIQRLLRISGNPVISVRLRNMGQTMATVQLRQGPWYNRFVELYPGQESKLSLAARAWPLLMGNTYPIAFRLHQGSQVWADWQWDPLQTAFQDTLAKQPLNALPQEQCFEAQVMRLLHDSRNQNWQHMQSLLDEMDIDPLALASEHNNWEQMLADYAGLNWELFSNANQIIYPVTSGDGAFSITSPGFSGALQWPMHNQQAWLKLKLKDSLSRGFWRLGILLHDKISQPVEVELWGQDKLASAILPAGGRSLYLPFQQTANANPVEVRIKLPSQDMALKAISLQCDLKAHMRKLGDWYWEAMARLNMQQGKYLQALQNLAAISPPLDNDLQVLQLRAQIAAGMPEQALSSAEQLRQAWHDYPEKLAILRELYNNLGQSERLAEVERRLADIRPSISKGAAFSNGLTLLGYDGPAASEIHPGMQLNYNFYWQASKQPLFNAEIFLYLLGPDTKIMQSMGLQHGPMTSLQAGQVLRESRQFTVPSQLAPGNYRLLVGLWDKAYKNQHLAIVDGPDKGRNETQLFSLEVK